MKMHSKITVRVDGNELIKKQDGTLDLGGTQRNTVKGNDVYGYSEEAMPASVEINAFIAAATDLETIRNAADVTVLATLDSGQQYVLSHAWLETPPKISEATDGGSMPLKFISITAEAV
ncbi:MAG: phage tail tube protein [Bradyrhizobium sp.]